MAIAAITSDSFAVTATNEAAAEEGAGEDGNWGGFTMAGYGCVEE